MSSFTFGAPASQATTSFGAPVTNHSAAGTLFGTTSTGFGSTNTTTATPSAAGSLFGNPPATSTSGSLFGSTPTPASSSGTFGFGASSTAPTSSTAPGSSFGFGNTQQPATTSTPGFGGFGKQPPATSTTGFGGFGTSSAATTSSAPATTGFGGFGMSSATTTSSAPATTSFGGFGSNQQQPQTSGFSGIGFGQQQQQKPATTGGFGGFGGFSGFGSNQQAQASSGGLGLNTGGGLFGQQKGTTGFGQTSTANAFGQPQQQPQPQQPQYNVWQQLALIKASWDPTSPLCQFRHYFYNMVPPNEVHLYVRPPNQDEQLWNEAQQKNPDLSCMVPVLAVGFEDVLKRMDIQDRQSELHKEKLEEVSQRLETVRRKYELGSRARLEEHKRRHADLTQRLIRLLRLVQVLRYKGFPLSNEEELSQKQFEELSTQTNNPEQLYTKMVELWSQLQAIKKSRSTSGDGHWEALNQNDTTRIAKVLGDEQQGLSHVIDILKKDLEDVKALEANIKLEAKNKENKQPLPV
ncbi:nucleoporin complex subunit 54-domain-containing protein [Halteromyces radiatus]|uniref:nucleoporin complex subunit 54-domain-containing protein n=1 Tax=Halteromyces radiatus TaxID=101107 RepID=UPI00221F8E2D|nr:nucleoporin complex subunit 54-domain-containing protein [Halteromyces radiatus]KAI8082877.1 nucleoporin complex subunit 54-domain-containing protein [Halteromyces radiatus]